MKTNNKLNKIRSKAKDVCVWIVIGLVIGCIVGWSTHTAIYNITHKEPEVSVGYVTGKLENIGELATQKLTYSGKVPLEEGSIPFITKKGFVMEYNARLKQIGNVKKFIKMLCIKGTWMLVGQFIGVLRQEKKEMSY